MDELLRKGLSVLRAMWHRRWIGLGAAWIAAIVGITVAMRVPERYEASARVYVDTQSLLRPLMAGLSIQPNVDQQVALMSRTLISRPNIEKLVRMADVDLAANSQSAHDGLVDSLMRSVQLSGNVNNNLYVIAYRNPNPETARKVVQALLTIFVESSLGDKRQDTRSAVKFLDDQIRQFEESLRASEDRLKEFRLKYLGVAGQSGPDYFGRLAKLSDEIDYARLQLKAAEQSRDSYKREVAGETPLLLPSTTPEAEATIVAVPAVDSRLATLRGELDGLRRRFTDSHPDVLAVQAMVKQLEEQRRQEALAMSKAVVASPKAREVSVDRNPVFQQLKVSLAEAEASVAGLRAKLSSYEAQYAQLRNAARLVPQVEAEFAQLNRDYDIQKKTYETLLTRRQSATIGEGVQDAGATQFRVIDPPRVSPTPVPPARWTLVMLAIAIAILTGFAASFAASEIMPTFHDARTLSLAAKRPVLGMVSLLPSPALRKIKRRRTFLFAGGLSALMASFIAVLAFALLAGRVA